MFTTQKLDYQTSEKRKHVRYRIDGDSMPIFDLGTARSLGQVENITVGGCLLKSEKATLLNRVFHFSMLLPGQLDEKAVVRCTARSQWSAPSTSQSKQGRETAEQFLTGYEFLDISDDGVETIEALIAILGRPQ